MPILVQRKLFQTGDSLAVTLPKAWIRRNQLYPGNKVKIIADSDLMVYPDEDEGKQKANTNKEWNKRGFYKLRYSVLSRDGFRCQYCGRSPQGDGVKLVVDHIIPVSKGGTNEENNLITACTDCNRGKGSSIDILLIQKPKNIDLTESK